MCILPLSSLNLKTASIVDLHIEINSTFGRLISNPLPAGIETLDTPRQDVKPPQVLTTWKKDFQMTHCEHTEKDL